MTMISIPPSGAPYPHPWDPATTPSADSIPPFTAVREDLFPARVYALPRDPALLQEARPSNTRNRTYVPQAATQIIDRARVIITLTAVYAFVDAPEGPTLAFASYLDDIEGSTSQGIRLTPSPDDFPPHVLHTTEPPYPSDAPPYLVVLRDTHCGCGSRVRTFRPWPSMPYAQARRRLG